MWTLLHIISMHIYDSSKNWKINKYIIDNEW